MDLDRRILLLTPTGRDTSMTRDVLERAGLSCASCVDVATLCTELDRGAATILVAEEALRNEGAKGIAQWLDAQPPWSDLPFLLLARPGADSATIASAVSSLRNVTVLERPLRVSALVSAVQSALRARARQHLLRDHVEQLESTQAQLRASDRRKDEFLAMLAHELRNPLAPVRNALSILEPLPFEPRVSQLHRMMHRQIDTMVRLVNDLLDVSRFTRGKIVLEDEQLDLRRLVNRAIETSQPLVDAAAHRLVVTLPDSPVWIRGDAIRLTQAFSNLLNNAAKYTPAHGTIRVRVDVDDRMGCVTVEDTGEGLASDKIEQVFDLFMQVRDARPASQGGLGIGLTLVKQLVEQHGGTVAAASAGVGKGSCFTVRLPRAARLTSVRAETPAFEPTHDLAGLRVLVADDNQDAANSLATLLELLGAGVEVVYDGRGAADTLLRGRTDVALLDIGMPDITGYEVAERVRAAKLATRPTLIAVTGWGQDSDRFDSRRAGFDHHLVKPVDPARVQRLLANVRSSSHREVPALRNRSVDLVGGPDQRVEG